MTTAPRCLYLDHTAKMSGGEIAMLRMVRALRGSVVPEVWLAEDGPLVAEFQAMGVPTRVVPLDSRSRNQSRHVSGLVSLLRLAPRAAMLLGYSFRLARMLRREQFDVIHCNSLKSGLYGSLAGRLSRVPVVWHVRDRLASDYMPKLMVSALRIAISILPSAVITNSESTASTVAGGRRSRASAVQATIFDTLDTSLYERSTRAPGQAFRFGMVGRMAPWKGQLLALDAFEAVSAQPLAVELHFAGAALFGEEEYVDRLRDRVGQSSKRDSVVLHGFVDDVPGFLGDMDALIHASTVPEPFGQVLVEGLAAGIPVVASDAGGAAEIISSELNGLLTPVGDVSALAEALQRLVDDSDLRKRLTEAGHERARAFRGDIIAREVVKLYDAIIVQPGTGALPRTA